MKKYFSILALSLCSIFSYSQAPDAFKYQTVVRNATGGIIANQLVKFRLSVLEDSPSGNSIFTETHQETTSNIGLVNFDIGRGQLVQGDFSMIEWGGSSHFLKIEFDKEGGDNFIEMGTVELLSVPYAKYAEKSNSSSVSDTERQRLKLSTYETFSLAQEYDTLFIEDEAGNIASSIDLNDIRVWELGGYQDAVQNPDLMTNYKVYAADSIESGTMFFAPKFNAQVNTGDYFFNVIDTSGALIASQRVLIGTGTNNSVYEYDVHPPNNGGDVSIRFFRHTNTGGVKRVNFLNGNGTTATNASIGVDGASSFFCLGSGMLGIGTSVPERILHVNGAFRMEPLNSAPSNPSKGDMYFDNTTNKLRVYDGTQWQNCF